MFVTQIKVFLPVRVGGAGDFVVRQKARISLLPGRDMDAGKHRGICGISGTGVHGHGLGRGARGTTGSCGQYCGFEIPVCTAVSRVFRSGLSGNPGAFCRD
jgi:hypothetical protein